MRLHVTLQDCSWKRFINVPVSPAIIKKGKIYLEGSKFLWFPSHPKLININIDLRPATYICGLSFRNLLHVFQEKGKQSILLLGKIGKSKHIMDCKSFFGWLFLYNFIWYSHLHLMLIFVLTGSPRTATNILCMLGIYWFQALLFWLRNVQYH